MGTSTVRRGPTSGLWRSAKAAATRYMSPAPEGEASAREVVARYLAAVAETPGRGRRCGLPGYPEGGTGPGGVGQEVAAGGWDVALRPGGLARRRPGDPRSCWRRGWAGCWPGAAGAWRRRGSDRAGPGERTGGAISRPGGPGSDGASVSGHGGAPASGPGPGGAPAGRGGRLRAAPGRLNRIKAVIEAGAEVIDAIPEPPDTPGLWQGLTGWTWVTEVMAGLMGNNRVRTQEQKMTAIAIISL